MSRALHSYMVRKHGPGGMHWSYAHRGNRGALQYQHGTHTRCRYQSHVHAHLLCVHCMEVRARSTAKHSIGVVRIDYAHHLFHTRGRRVSKQSNHPNASNGPD